MANIIRIKRGLKANVNVAELLQGELAIATDTQELYVGNAQGRAELVKAATSGVVESAEKLDVARQIALTGDASGSTSFDGSQDVQIAVALANSGVVAGTYTKLTVDAKGRVTAGTQLSKSDLPELGVADISGLTTALAGKVDVDGAKGLSTNDFTNAYKNKLDGLENYDDTEIRGLISGKADASTTYTKTEVNNLLDDKADKSDLQGLATEEYVNTALEDYTDTNTLTTLLSDKVDKVTGKQLSTEDYTTAEKTKLAGLENYDDTAVKALIAAKQDPATTLSGYGITDAYTKTEVDAKVSSVYKYKGSKQTYAELPSTGQAVGDVWNIEIADPTHGILAGDNVAWTGTTWDKLAGTIDLSAYETTSHASSTYATIATTYTKTETDTAIATELQDYTDTNTLNTLLAGKVDVDAGKGLSSNDYTTTEKNKLAGIAENAQVNKIETVKVNGTAQTITSKAVDISVPTKLTDLTNDGNFVTDASYVHTDANFTTTEKTKLASINNGAEPNVQSDWSESDTTSDAFIVNKPTNVSAFTNDAGYLTGNTTIDGGTF